MLCSRDLEPKAPRRGFSGAFFVMSDRLDGLTARVSKIGCLDQIRARKTASRRSGFQPGKEAPCIARSIQINLSDGARRGRGRRRALNDIGFTLIRKKIYRLCLIRLKVSEK